VPGRVGRKETRFIASLFEVPREIEQASVSEFLAEIVQRCADWFGATTVSLFLREGNESFMSLAATGGDMTSIPKQARIEIGKGIAGTAAEDGAPVILNEPRHRNLVSSMVVPLTSASAGCIGVLNLSRKVGLERFSNSDLRLARSVASHLALAVENARLVANLKGERARFRGIFDGLGLAAFLLDAQGEIVESNTRAKTQRDIPRAALASHVRKAKRRDVEFTDEATGRSWHAVLAPLPDGGATLVLEETTQKERNRREMDRLNRLAEIGQMTAAIAHEIRNPLTSIRSAAQMIQQLPDASEEFAKIIEHEALKLNELCSEFLNFAKPLELRNRDVDLAEIVQHMRKLMEPQFISKGVSLDVQIGGQLPIIHGDPLRLEQVLQNLMLNALEASAPGGAVTLGLSDSGIWVEDQGCGMAPEQVNRLFTPFFTTKPQGTGLGLSTVKKIVDAHGASIQVRSNQGQGTRFEISFERRKAA
jgi:signal transduction histidine kinase